MGAWLAIRTVIRREILTPPEMYLPQTIVAGPFTSTTSFAWIDASELSAGYYAIKMIGDDGGGTPQPTTIDVFVQASFGMYAAPESLTVPVGGAAQTSTITLTPTGSFTGVVSLTAQAYLFGAPVTDGSITASLVPPRIDCSTSSLTSTLSVGASSTATPGDYIVLVTGTDASNNQTSCSVEATVQTGSFTIAANPDWLDVSAGDETRDLTTVSLSGLGSFAGNATVTVISITDANGNDVTSGGGIDCWFTSSGDATSNPLAAGGQDTLNAIAGYDTAEGDYTITLTAADASGNTSTTTLDLEVDAGFELYAEPTSLTIPAGGTGASIISAGSFGSPYGSAIALEQPQIFDMNGNPVIDGSVSVSLSQSSINVDDGSTSTATVSVGADVPAGSTYTVFITGAGPGGSESSAQISVTVANPSITLDASPSPVSVNAGDTAGQTSTVSVIPSGGFTGLVSLSVGSVTGTAANGNALSGTMPMVSLSANSITIGPDGNGQSVPATISADATVTPGTYTTTIAGVSGTVSGNATLTIMVNAANSPTLTIDTTPNNGDVDTPINLTCVGSLSGTYEWSAGTVWRSDTANGTYNVYSGGDISFSWVDAESGETDPASQYATLQATFGTPGYYIVQANAIDTLSGVTYTATGYIGGNPPSAASLDAVRANTVAPNLSTPTPSTPVDVAGGSNLKILFGGIDITGKTVPVDSGQLINLTVQTPSSMTLDPGSENWYVDGHGSPIAGWDPKKVANQTTPLAPSMLYGKSSISFYWIIGGAPAPSWTYSVRFNASDTATHAIHSAQATFAVFKPAYQFDIQISPIAAYLDPKHDVPYAFGPKNPKSGEDGAVYSAPTGRVYGTYDWCQTIMKYHSQKYYLGAWMDIDNSTPGSLDTQFPYAIDGDTPEFGVPWPPIPVKASFDVITHEMWRSPKGGSIWVPLGNREWSFSGAASKQKGVWTLTSSPNAYHVDDWLPDYQEPQWVGVGP